jgi:hypothetical protein
MEQRRFGEDQRRRCFARGTWVGAKTQARSDPTHQQSERCHPWPVPARPPLFAGRLRGFYGISLGFRAGFTAALRDAQILAPRGYVSDK